MPRLNYKPIHLYIPQPPVFMRSFIIHIPSARKIERNDNRNPNEINNGQPEAKGNAGVGAYNSDNNCGNVQQVKMQYIVEHRHTPVDYENIG